MGKKIIFSKDKNMWNIILAVSIVLWIIGLFLIPQDDRDSLYFYLYAAPALTWMSSESLSPMMQYRNYAEYEFVPTIIVNCHIAVGLWWLNNSATTISTSLFSAGCLLAIIWRGNLGEK